MPAIDLSHRIIQPAPPAKPSSVRWHPWRRALQLICGVLLVALPLTDGLRLDVRRGILFFAWRRMTIHDQTILFWVFMLGIWGLVTVSFLYGRLWCGWVCPQTITSDFADSVKTRIDRIFHARPGRFSFLISRSLWVSVVLAVSIAAGIVLAMYWLAPADVWRAASRPALDPAAAYVVYGIAGILGVDMLWIRRRFCSHVCPYGPLLGILGDKNTLAVRYIEERDDECIRCGKCVVDCPMGIDIKKGVAQHDCIGCGDCVDSCNDVLGKRGVPGLIEYRFGVEPERAMPALTPMQRLGLWDPLRWTVLGTLGMVIVIIATLLLGRWPATASINADGAVARNDAAVTNGYSLTVNNNSPDAVLFNVSVAGLPGAAVDEPALKIEPRGNTTISEKISVPVSMAPAEGQRAPIRIIVKSGKDDCVVRTFFYSPRPGE